MMNRSPEPSFAARARALVQAGRGGALATHSRQRPGYPFGSGTPYPAGERGRPGVSLQRVAPRHGPSLLVAPPEPVDDPLAAPRVTVLGEARRLDPSEAAADRARYLAQHPSAAMWVDFADFAFWRLA